MQARIVHAVKTRQDGKGGGQGRLFENALCVSDQQENWDTWAEGSRSMNATRHAFAPSILYICVGISIIIILSNFISQTSNALSTRDALAEMMVKLKDINFIFQNMAVGSLKLATCVDPVQLQQMKRVKVNTYANQLVDWAPISSGIESVTNAPDLTNIFKQNEVPSPQDIVSGKYLDDIKMRLIQALPSILQPLIISILTNVSDPDSVSTLPVFGPTIGCLFKQYGSEEVQNFINFSLTTVNSQASKVQIQLPQTSADTCRYF
jgi:hypothetical protein